MKQDINELRDISSEAGIIATLIHHPDFYFHSEQLLPTHFYDEQNGLIYFAISELAKLDNATVDAYNIKMMLNQNKMGNADSISIESLNSLVETSDVISRNTVDEYKIMVNGVLEKSFRRQLYTTLLSCEQLVFKGSETGNISQEISEKVEKVIENYIGIDEIKEFGEKVDELWGDILDRHANDGACGIRSKIPKLNEYLTFEESELILCCAARKEGKSMYALNEVIDKLKKGYSVVHIDTEMCDRQQLERMLSCLTKIPVRLIKNGKYEEKDVESIDKALKWIKSVKYIHEYMPTPDMNKIYAIVKKLKHKNKVDFVVYDYIKSQDSTSSSEIYNLLGDYCNFLKNKIAGDLKVPVLTLAQTNRGGEIADSYKLEQFASSVIVLKRKTKEEYLRDGAECGNYKVFVKLNRLGEQMANIDEDYIDLAFAGDIATFEQAPKQHEPLQEEEQPF